MLGACVSEDATYIDGTGDGYIEHIYGQTIGCLLLQHALQGGDVDLLSDAKVALDPELVTVMNVAGKVQHSGAVPEDTSEELGRQDVKLSLELLLASA